MSIDREQPLPLYFQLKTLLMEDILSGRYGPGDQLPTEHQLCAHYDLSRSPVNRALRELADEGVILRRRGSGSYVNPHWIRRRTDGPELRVLLTEGVWDRIVRDSAPRDVRLNVATVSRPELHHQLTRAVAEGQAPDLALLDSVWVSEFAAAGFLLPLDDLDPAWTEGDHRTDFLEPCMRATLFEGRPYAVSADADVAGLWYRRDVLREAGLEPPTTWVELRHAARAAAAAGIPTPIVLPAGSRGEETTTYCLLALLASNGAEVLTGGGIALDTPNTAQTLRFLRQLADEGLLPSEAVAYEWNRPARLLGEGAAAFSFGGSYEAGDIAEAMGIDVARLWEHVGFSAVPAGPRGAPACVLGSMVYVIFRQAEQPKLAMRVIEHLVAPDRLARMARLTGRIPTRRSAVELTREHSPLLALTSSLLEHAVVRPQTPAYPRVSAQLASMLEAVLTGRTGPGSAAARVADMIHAITGLPLLRSP